MKKGQKGGVDLKSVQLLGNTYKEKVITQGFVKVDDKVTFVKF